MDEDEAREDEVTEDTELEEGQAEEAEETEQQVEEHDWGSMESRMDDLEQRINELAEAMATMSIDAEDNPAENPAKDADEEYGEAVDLDELETMLGL